MVKTSLLCLVSFFFGAVFYMNFALSNTAYRISFYGYAKEGGKVYPVIKLRKRIGNPARRYHPSDEGVLLDIAEVGMSGGPGQSIEFTDKQIQQAYCKESYAV